MFIIMILFVIELTLYTIIILNPV